MRSTSDGCKITLRVVGALADPVIDSRNDRAEERTEFGGSICHVIGRGHGPVSELCTKRTVEEVNQLRLGDRRSVEVEGLAVVF